MIREERDKIEGQLSDLRAKYTDVCAELELLNYVDLLLGQHPAVNNGRPVAMFPDRPYLVPVVLKDGRMKIQALPIPPESKSDSAVEEDIAIARSFGVDMTSKTRGALTKEWASAVIRLYIEHAKQADQLFIEISELQTSLGLRNFEARHRPSSEPGKFPA